MEAGAQIGEGIRGYPLEDHVTEFSAAGFLLSLVFWNCNWDGNFLFPFLYQLHDGLDHLLVGAATADMPAQVFLDFLNGGFWLDLQQVMRDKHKGWRTEATLQGAVFYE